MKHRYKTFSMILVLTMILNTFAPWLVSGAEDYGRDLARNRPVIASIIDPISVGDQYDPEKAVDGDSNTRWAGGMLPDTAWICVDLGAVYDLSTVVLNWEAARAATYELQVSRDAKTFTKIYDGTTTQAGKQTVEGLSGSGRYIRMYEKTRAIESFGASLWDFEVYGTLSEDQSGVVDVRILNLRDADGGQITTASPKWVYEGDTVDLTFVPDGSNLLESVTVNGNDCTAQVQNNHLVLTVGKENLDVSATFKEDQGLENVALHKKAIASFYEGPGLEAGKAFDGDQGTRWAVGGATGDTWMCVDLGGIYDISRLVYYWQNAFASKWRIEVSDDYRAFTPVYDGATATYGKQTVSDISCRGRYVKFVELERGLPPWGTSLFEMEIYGKPAQDQTGSGNVREVGITQSDGGKIKADTSGWVIEGDTIRVAFEPHDTNELLAAYCNGRDITEELVDGVYTTAVTQDLQFTADYKINPGRRYEAEDCTLLDENGNVIGTNRIYDEKASGGYYVGGTGGKSFIFDNIALSNQVSAAFASNNTNSISVYVRYPGEEAFQYAGAMTFATTQSWGVERQGVCYSSAVYIPEGASVKLVPNADVDLDYFMFTNDPLGSEENVPANTVLAKNAQLTGAEKAEDMMSTVGQVAQLDNTGDKVTFTVPDESALYNVVNLKYKANSPVSVGVSVNGGPAESVELDATKLNNYTLFGKLIGEIRPGDTVEVSYLGGGALLLDSAAFNFAEEPDVVSIGALPKGSARMEVSLDGIWAADCVPFGAWEVPETVPELGFTNSVPVPGLWDITGYSMGDYTSSMMWQKIAVNLEEEPTGSVMLRINRAQFGRYIYVNGSLIDSYEYNYSLSETDISAYLHRGENEIAVMLGAWARQKNAPDCDAHVLNDGEKSENLPGITDSVSLIFRSEPYVKTIKTAADLENGSVKARIKLGNKTAQPVSTDVQVNIYELGVFENGQPTQEKVKVAGYTEPAVSVGANGEMEFDIDAIRLSGFDASKYWSPDNPYLYEIEVITSGDTLTDRFGMRTFYYDKETKLPMLNGKVHYLFGTNVAINRFFDDPMREELPWTEDWIRKLYQEFKETGWEVMRTHLGTAPAIWYDIADEEGYMIVDEYAWWGCSDGCTMETLMPEVYRWMDERYNNPCVITWDIQNEDFNGDVTTKVITEARSYDIQDRGWDNGWAPPESDYDTIECHPYIMSAGFKIENLNGFPNGVHPGAIEFPWDARNTPNPKVINEYGSIWLDRLGDATYLTKGTWDAWMPDGTREERLTYYADALSALTEFWRAGRAYVGILHFGGLVYSKPDQKGATGDVLMPDISSAQTLEVRPYTKELFRNAFAPLGLAIENYTEKVQRGQQLTMPVTLINDTNDDIEDLEVTLRIYHGDRVLYEDSKLYSAREVGTKDEDIATQDFTVTVPSIDAADGNQLRVVASYTRDGETIYSQRKWTVNGGSSFEGYSVSAQSEATILFDKTTAQPGETVSFTVTDLPQDKTIQSVSIRDASGSPVAFSESDDGVFQFLMPDSPVIVCVEVDVPPVITSEVYKVHEDGKIISGIEASTPARMLLARLSVSDEQTTLQLTDSTGAPLDADAPVVTGALARILRGDRVAAVYQLSVLGDLDGGSAPGVQTLLRMKSHILGRAPLTSLQACSSDMDQNGKVNVLDLVRLKLLILKG